MGVIDDLIQRRELLRQMILNCIRLACPLDINSNVWHASIERHDGEGREVRDYDVCKFGNLIRITKDGSQLLSWLYLRKRAIQFMRLLGHLIVAGLGDGVEHQWNDTSNH